MAKEMTQPTDEQIRTRAYFLWEADGCPQGKDWEYWMMAQGDLTSATDSVKTTSEVPAKKTSAASGKKEATSKRRSNQGSAVYA